MITSLVIADYMANIRSELSPPIKFFTKNVYSPGLQWDPDYRKHFVLSDQNQKVLQGTKDFVGIVWDRSSLRPCAEGARKHLAVKKALPNLNASLFHGRELDFDLNYAFVSSSVSLIETLEEYLLVNRLESTIRSVTLQSGDKIDYNLREQAISGLQQLEEKTYGTTFILSMSVLINFMAVVQIRDGKLIGEINATTFLTLFSHTFE